MKRKVKIYALDKYLKKICSEPWVIEEDKWKCPNLIPCGKCLVCIKNKEKLNKMNKGEYINDK